MNICIIAHGNAQLGMGHVMRSLALAEAFRKDGHNVYFYSKYSQGVERIQRQGFKAVGAQKWDKIRDVVGFEYGTPEELFADVKDIVQYVQEMQDVIVIDSYNVSREFFLGLKQYTRVLVYIDDLNTFAYPVDIIINGTVSAPYMGYKKLQNARLLLGVKYNLLRSEFCNLPKKEIDKEIKNVLITTGNSDPFHITEKILRIFIQEKRYDGLNFHVIVGSGFETDIRIQQDIANCLSVYFYDKPDKMSKIMQKCDIAVAAGGSTLYELAACGVPALVFDYAENQIPQIMAMKQDGLVKYIGSYKKLEKEKVLKEFQHLQLQYKERKKLVKRLQSLVDAQGPGRVVEEVKNYYENRLDFIL